MFPSALDMFGSGSWRSGRIPQSIAGWPFRLLEAFPSKEVLVSVLVVKEYKK